jgi:hypothetical protein
MKKLLRGRFLLPAYVLLYIAIVLWTPFHATVGCWILAVLSVLWIPLGIYLLRRIVQHNWSTMTMGGFDFNLRVIAIVLVALFAAMMDIWVAFHPRMDLDVQILIGGGFVYIVIILITIFGMQTSPKEPVD